MIYQVLDRNKQAGVELALLDGLSIKLCPITDAELSDHMYGTSPTHLRQSHYIAWHKATGLYVTPVPDYPQDGWERLDKVRRPTR